MTNENELWEPAKDVKDFFPPDFWQIMNNSPIVMPNINDRPSQSAKQNNSTKQNN